MTTRRDDCLSITARRDMLERALRRGDSPKTVRDAHPETYGGDAGMRMLHRDLDAMGIARSCLNPTHGDTCMCPRRLRLDAARDAIEAA